MNAATQSSRTPADNSSPPSPPTMYPLLANLLRLEINRSIIEYIVHCLIETVDYALDRPCTTSFNSRPTFCSVKYGPLTEFVSKMVYRSRIKIPVVLVMLAYISRAKAHLKITIEQWACVRVFMGATVLAGKYSSDFVMKNSNWALWSGIFRPCDVGRMERELLDVLDWDLTIRESDILEHHEFLTTATSRNLPLYQPSIFVPTSIPVLLKRRRSSCSSSLCNASQSSITSPCSSSSSLSSFASKSITPSSSSSSSSSSSASLSSIHQQTPPMQSQHQCVKLKSDPSRPSKRIRIAESCILSTPRYPPLIDPSSFVKDTDYIPISGLFKP